MLNRIKSFFDVGDLVFLLTWAVVFGLSVYILQNASDELFAQRPIVISLFLFYVLCFFPATRTIEFISTSVRHRHIFFGLQLIAAFALNALLPIDFLPILTIMWAAFLPFFTSFKRSVFICTLVIVAWFSLSSHVQDENHTFAALLYGTFHLFAIYAHTQTRLEKEAREALQAKHQELRATQHLLSEASKQSERVRIARDLHDLLGHHLTALTINLQIAGRLTEGDAKRHVNDSHQIAKLLLNDVRDAVSRLRENQSLDLKQAITVLVECVPHIKVKLNMDDEIAVDDLDAAHTILKCIQEAITNSMKHSHANHIFINLQQIEQRIHLEMSDDGYLKPEWQEGNGIIGMRERIEDCFGEIQLDSQQGQLKYIIQLPLTG